MKWTWQQEVIDRALRMAKMRHISKYDALVEMGSWLFRAAARLPADQNIYTGKPNREGAKKGGSA